MNKQILKLFGMGLFFLTLVSCTNTNENKTKISGNIAIDGSSTVYPITEIIAEEFSYAYPQIRVSISESGTGGGMRKLLDNQIDIVNASRKIKESEYNKAKENGMDIVELVAAQDGITVVINSKNDFAQNLTKEELSHIFRQENPAVYWSEVREGFPREKIKVYTPGASSGTFEFFTKMINGIPKSQREDSILSEDDNVIIRGISEEKYAIGYFGYSYYESNKSKIKLVSIDGVFPSSETIKNGNYLLARPLYVYLDKNDLSKEEIYKFVEFYMQKANEFAPEVNLIGLSQEDYNKQLENLK